MDGNDPQAAQGRVQRGQRVFCSNRGRRGGCGRTFCLLFAWVLPRHTFTAAWLWKALEGLPTAASIKSRWEALRLPFALETLYHLLRRLQRRLDALRTHLCRAGPPPPAASAEPLHQTVAHLRSVFPSAACPLEAFQQAFQQPLLG